MAAAALKSGPDLIWWHNGSSPARCRVPSIPTEAVGYWDTRGRLLRHMSLSYVNFSILLHHLIMAQISRTCLAACHSYTSAQLDCVSAAHAWKSFSRASFMLRLDTLAMCPHHKCPDVQWKVPQDLWGADVPPEIPPLAAHHDTGGWSGPTKGGWSICFATTWSPPACIDAVPLGQILQPKLGCQTHQPPVPGWIQTRGLPASWVQAHLLWQGDGRGVRSIKEPQGLSLTHHR